MPELRVEVDPEVAEALATESDLLGFGDEPAYLAWIVGNRAAIEQGTESAELLAAYRTRLEALEARLAAEGVDPDEVDGESVATGSTADDPSATAAATDHDAAATIDAATATDDPAGTTDDAAATTDDAGTTDDAATTDDPAATVDEESATATSPSSDDAPAGSGRSEPAPSSADTGGESTPAASDGGTTTIDADVTSMHLRPERVQRIDEDPVSRDADELADVETMRVDELSRRAVAETRRQLDREVETGLSYDSSAAMPSSDVRPSEDLADLDAIEVPGCGDVAARRREVVGRALALLRDAGSARRSDVVDALYEEHPVGYETADGWWRCVREGLRQVEGVDGGHVWEYVG